MLDAGHDEGLRTFMCTTHERIGEICDHVRANPDRYAGFKFYPCMPYAHKYSNAVTDYAMIGAVMHFMPDDGIVRTALRGMSLARKDVEGLAKILVDMEMKMFRGLETPVIFLQNVVVLLLGSASRTRSSAPTSTRSASGLGRRRGLRGDAPDPEGAGDRHVGARLGRHPLARGAVMGGGAAERRAIVFGTSSRKNIRDTRQIVEDLYAARGGRSAGQA